MKVTYFLIALVLITSCAKPTIIATKKLNDSKLDCEEIELQIFEAQKFKADACATNLPFWLKLIPRFPGFWVKLIPRFPGFGSSFTRRTGNPRVWIQGFGGPYSHTRGPRHRLRPITSGWSARHCNSCRHTARVLGPPPGPYPNSGWHMGQLPGSPWLAHCVEIPPSCV